MPYTKRFDSTSTGTKTTLTKAPDGVFSLDDPTKVTSKSPHTLLLTRSCNVNSNPSTITYTEHACRLLLNSESTRRPHLAHLLSLTRTTKHTTSMEQSIIHQPTNNLKSIFPLQFPATNKLQNKDPQNSIPSPTKSNQDLPRPPSMATNSNHPLPNNPQRLLHPLPHLQRENIRLAHALR